MKDFQYLRQAYEEAKYLSTDPSTQNGAVLINPEGIVIATAANHFPRGVQETPERWDRPLKYHYVEHAERNALYKAAKLGHKTYGSKMYVPWFACADCARGIIQCGVEEVIGHQKMYDGTPDRWKESIHEAWTMLDEAGVKHRLIVADFGIKIRFNGQEWES